MLLKCYQHLKLIMERIFRSIVRKTVRKFEQVRSDSEESPRNSWIPKLSRVINLISGASDDDTEYNDQLDHVNIFAHDKMMPPPKECFCVAIHRYFQIFSSV